MTRAQLSFVLLLLVFTACSNAAFAQRSVEERIADRLIERGFESVRVESGSDGLLVEFENRVFRYDITALQEAADIVFSMSGAPDDLTIIPRRRGIRLAAVWLHRAGNSSSVDEERISASPQVTPVPGEGAFGRLFPGGKNPSSFKLDVAVYPQLVAQFGSFSDAVRSQINLVPAVSINLWHGFQVYGEIILPIQNELDKAEDDVRPGIISANQTLRLPGGVFLSATIGTFTRDRYGADVEVLVPFMRGRFDAIGRIGRTGYARYAESAWQYASLDQWTSTAGIRYNLARYDMSTTIRFGRFLADDTGVIVNVDRYFGEFRVGFFGIASDAGENAGFRIAIPMPMREHMRPRRARVRIADRFDWTYRYRGLTDAGLDVETGHSLEGFQGVWIAPYVPSLYGRLPSR